MDDAYQDIMGRLWSEGEGYTVRCKLPNGSVVEIAKESEQDVQELLSDVREYL